MKRGLLFAGLAAAVAGTAPLLHAQGSAVMTHSACAVAMGAAGVASPCADGSAVLFNPAALALQPGVVGLGASGITTSGSFTFDRTGERFERDQSTSAVPFGYASYRVGEKLAVAIGAFAPYGLGIDWPQEFEGRFASYDTDLTNIYIQPTLAYQVDRVLSVGAGVDVVLSSIGINQRVDLATVPLPVQPVPGRISTFGNLGIPLGTDFANVGLEGSGTGVGYHLGALLRLSEAFSLGARYLSSVRVDLEGSADFTQVPTNIVLAPGNPLRLPAGTPLDAVVARSFTEGTLVDQDVLTGLELPAQFVVGVAFEPGRMLKLTGDFQWTGWSSFGTETLDFSVSPDQPLILDYKDTQTYRAGAEVRPLGSLALRGGYIYNTAAQKEFSVSPLLPESERNYYSVGAGLDVRPGLRLDVAYQLVDQDDVRGRVRGRPAGLSEAQLRALNVGVFESDASILSATVGWQFGPRR